MDIVGKVPATVFTGFLGSGKTTIISHLIDYLLEQRVKVAYIKNEIGDADIDGKIIRGKNIQTRELLNGCICCALTGPFYHAMNELVETVHPDRILIEASGVADPATVALMLSSHPKVYRDGVIAIIDTVNFEGYKNLSLTARRQAEFTDLIVFNKIELVDLPRKQAVVGYVRELNENSPIVEAPLGNINPDFIFGLDTYNLSNLLHKDEIDYKNDCHRKTHLEDERIEIFKIEFINPVDLVKIREVLDNLPPNIIRVKGFVKTKENQLKIINKVGARTTITDMAVNEILNCGIIVFIGFAITENQKDIENKLIDFVSQK
jgi:G3E family GTPase